MTNINATNMDKSVFLVADVDDESDERAFWRQQAPSDRLFTVELLRQVMYGYDPLTTRLQRILTVAEQPHG